MTAQICVQISVVSGVLPPLIGVYLITITIINNTIINIINSWSHIGREGWKGDSKFSGHEQQLRTNSYIGLTR